MKRIFLMLLCATVFVPIWASDIIVTTDAERIDAKIEEVSETGIKYKRMDNLNGPTFVISTSKISSIIYENGTVSVFDKKQQTQQYVGSGSTIVDGIVSAYGINQSQALPEYMIQKSGDYYYLGDQRMDKDTYLKFIEKNCPEAWQSYCKGKKLFGAGIGLLCAGSGLFIAGIGLAAAGGWGVYRFTYNPNTGKVYNTDYDAEKAACFYAGAIFMSFGSTAMAGSIPLFIVGSIKKNNSHEVYNESCAAKQTAMTVNLTAGTNGLGLALNF